MKSLRMVFGTVSGNNWSLTLRYPKEDITAAEVTTAMQSVIDSGVFASGLNSILSAEVIERTVSELVNNE
ncbi:MAG: DUF2922 domain-containing protein [Synergistota bacterium]|nr:DUF2922 domain-containing protein [Synergistota bacterium]